MTTKSKGSKATNEERARQRKAMRNAGFNVNDDGDLVGYDLDEDDLVRRAKSGAIPADMAEVMIWASSRGAR